MEEYTAVKDQNKRYYTGAAGASEFHDLLSHHHRAYGKGIQMPVGNILQVEG